MKTLVLAIIFGACAIPATAQKLIDIYKQGSVKLIPDQEYATGNDWDQVFRTYTEVMNKEAIGKRKSIKIMPDGSVVVNHAYHNYFTKFNPAGKFEKEFGIKDTQGKILKRNSPIEGILNNKIFFTGTDNTGKIICFDFNGDYMKTLTLDYMVRQMVSLSDNKIAILGYTIWPGKTRDFVAIIDYETNKEKMIWDQFNEYSGEFAPPPPPLALPQIINIQNSIVIAFPNTGAILKYDLQGNLISKQKADWEPGYISVEEQKEMRRKAIDEMKETFKASSSKGITEENKKTNENIIKAMEENIDKITTPRQLPFFSTIIKDSDGNLLFFEYPKEENANRFNVWIYDNGGKSICKSSLVCDEYSLEINPSKMVFHNGYIYGLQELKNAQGIPLRLVRFKIASN